MGREEVAKGGRKERRGEEDEPSPIEISCYSTVNLGIKITNYVYEYNFIGWTR